MNLMQPKFALLLARSELIQKKLVPTKQKYSVREKQGKIEVIKKLRKPLTTYCRNTLSSFSWPLSLP